VLRLVRGDPSRARFDGKFFDKDDRFWPLVTRARLFADYTDWPDVTEYNALLPSDAVVRFVPQVVPPQRSRRSEKPVRRADDLYDACIMRGEVPTRPRSWHDYLNALVWATFPLAKAVLHARQHAVITRWLQDEGVVRADGTLTTLPNARTREHDALALVDEGGVVVLCDGDRELAVTFGHALYEGMVIGTPSMISRGVQIPFERLNTDRASAISIADELLAARLQEHIIPEQLPRYVF
jgi:Protein of unknown function (DUF3025)